MTPKSRAPLISTQPRDSPARTRQPLVFEKPAPSPVTVERQTETISQTAILQPDLGVKLGGCKDSLNFVRGEML